MSHGANWSANFWGRFQSESSWAGNTVLRALRGGCSPPPEAGKPPQGTTLSLRQERGSWDQRRENRSWGDRAWEPQDLASGQPNAPLLSTYCVQALCKSDLFPTLRALSPIKATH